MTKPDPHRVAWHHGSLGFDQKIGSPGYDGSPGFDSSPGLTWPTGPVILCLCKYTVVV